MVMQIEYKPTKFIYGTTNTYDFLLKKRWFCHVTQMASNKLVTINQKTFFYFCDGRILIWHVHRHYLIRNKIRKFGGKSRISIKLIVSES
jgi:hypothetical protein